MKKLLVILIALVTILSGCRYKEGPLICFRSVERRLDGIWQIVEFTSNGTDYLKKYNDTCGGKMNISLCYSDGSPKPISEYQINFLDCKTQMSLGGHFIFSNNKKIINVNFGDTLLYKSLGPLGGGKSDWKILKLKYNYLKISTDFNGRNYIISCKILLKR
jgi:hypothetical protein